MNQRAVDIIDRWIDYASTADDHRRFMFWKVRDVLIGLRVTPEIKQAALECLAACRQSADRDLLIEEVKKNE